MSSSRNLIWILKCEQVQLWISCIFSWKDLNNWLTAGLLGRVLNLLPEVCSSCSLIRTKDMFLPDCNQFMCLSTGRNPEGWFIAGCVLLVAGCDLLTVWCVRCIYTSLRRPLNSGQSRSFTAFNKQFSFHRCYVPPWIQVRRSQLHISSPQALIVSLINFSFQNHFAPMHLGKYWLAAADVGL